MGFALITHPARFRPIWRGLMAPMVVNESSLPIALAQGWMVLARDSDVLQVNIDANLQRNPNRAHGYGYTEDDGA